jgi:bacterioferritin (cytochrome b1)
MAENMKKSNDDLIEFLKNQVVVEKEIVNSLEKETVDMKNPAVKAVLKGVSLDSLKHAELYSAAITLLTGFSPALMQEHLDRQAALVKKHIEVEARLIRKLEEIMPTVENKKVEFLLKSILADESKHHGMLKMVLEIIVHGETITEADWWKLLWENAPFHGSPGG